MSTTQIAKKVRTTGDCPLPKQLSRWISTDQDSVEVNAIWRESLRSFYGKFSGIFPDKSRLHVLAQTVEIIAKEAQSTAQLAFDVISLEGQILTSHGWEIQTRSGADVAAIQIVSCHGLVLGDVGVFDGSLRRRALLPLRKPGDGVIVRCREVSLGKMSWVCIKPVSECKLVLLLVQSMVEHVRLQSRKVTEEV